MKFFIFACFNCLVFAYIRIVTIRDNRFVFQDNGQEFIVNGLAYQPRINGEFQDEDVVSDDMQEFWSKDLPYFKDLGVNVLRVYEIDGSKKHEKFMKALQELGIYVLFDIPDVKNSINRIDPSYTVDYFNHIRRKAIELSAYSNTLGFFVGNEVANSPGRTTKSAAFVKALTRDLKSFMKRTKSMRYIPLGYAAVDDNTLRLVEARYFVCGNRDESVDFYGINIYSWCGDSTMKQSGYRDRLDEFRGFPVPIFFSEYGCNTQRPRIFGDVSSLFGPMLEVFSGAIAYEYSEEDNGYGLVKVAGKARRILQDYKNLQSQLMSVNAVKSIDVDLGKRQTESNWSNITCPEKSDVWLVNPSMLPPIASEKYCDCIESAQLCQVYSSAISPKNVGLAIGFICGDNQTSCESIKTGDPSIGNYGKFSTCSASTKLAIALSNVPKSTCKLDGGNYARMNQNRKSGDQCSVEGKASENSRKLYIFQFILVIAIEYLFIH